MIRVPPQIAAILTGLWAVGIAYTSQLPHLPGWAPYAIAGAGVLLAGFGVEIPQVKSLVHSRPSLPAGSDVLPPPPGGAVE